MSYFDINRELGWEEKAIRESAHQFAVEVLRPASIEIDKMTAEEAISVESPMWDALGQAYKLGYHKAMFPESIGGGGLTPLQGHILLEELMWGSLGITGVMFLSTWVFGALLTTGDEALIEEFVLPFVNCDDGSVRGCWAIMEPDHGSDMIGQGETFYIDSQIKGQVRAVLDGNEWILNGQKAAWVSGAPIATHCKLNVQIDQSLGLSGGGYCIVPLDLPGISRGKALEKIGQRDLPQGELFFDNVKIPKHYMFVEPEHYPQGVLASLGHGNTAMSVVALAVARAAFEDSLAYAKVRVQGGKPLVEHYAMKIRLHKMFSKVEAIRALSRAVWDLNNTVHPPLPEYGFAAKTFCTDTAVELAYEAVQIHGANGLTKEYFVEKLYRDARALTIEDGENNTLHRAGGDILKDTFPRIESTAPSAV
jgi:alkylation response protein AidB-like acyl-CoA dehydrogenase